MIKKKLFDEVHSILKIYVSAQYREVEAIYLINILQSLGDKYLIDPTLLVMYLPSNPDKFDYFLIVNLLNYASINPVVYGSVLKKVQELIIEKLEIESKTGSSMLIKAELVFLLFDIMNCPHLEQVFKYKFLAYFDIVADSEKQKIIDFILRKKLFFTKWRSTNFLQEIVKKRKIEVY